jgi:phage recombination protein Bet
MIEEKVEAFVKEANAEFGDEILKTDEIKPDKWEGSTKEDGSPDCISILETGKGHVYVDLQTGEIVTKLDRPWIATLRKRMDAPPKPNQANVPATIQAGEVTRSIDSLTITDVKTYFCPAAQDTDAYIFLEVCRSKGLNPFLREAYLVAFEDKKAGEFKTSIIVGKDAFVRKAEEHPDFDGFRAGLIIQDAEGAIHFDREGEFMTKDETLLGGWAEVKRKGISSPFKAAVSLTEYRKDNHFWKDKPATLIRKVALVHALREAFAETFGGLYDQSEMDAK